MTPSCKATISRWMGGACNAQERHRGDHQLIRGIIVNAQQKQNRLEISEKSCNQITDRTKATVLFQKRKLANILPQNSPMPFFFVHCQGIDIVEPKQRFCEIDLSLKYIYFFYSSFCTLFPKALEFHFISVLTTVFAQKFTNCIITNSKNCSSFITKEKHQEISPQNIKIVGLD